MSLRKTAGLLAAFGLTVGLIGGGVSATWTDQVTASQTLNIAAYSCAITAKNGVAIAPTHSISYTVPTIVQSAAGSAPFTFDVTNQGGVAMNLAVVAPAAYAPFNITPLTWSASALNVPGGASRMASTGVTWGDLTAYAGTGPYTFTWTVNCNETTGPAVTFYSTNYGVYGGQPSVRFAGDGSGFTPGDTIDVQYTWAAGGPFDLALYWGYLGLTAPVAAGDGTFTYWFADNCHDGISYTTDQPVTVSASDTHGHTANGTGILACSMMP